jgi:hypothetical protein
MTSQRLLIALAILMAAFGCGSERTTMVPDELVGTWRTLEPKYADTYIALTRNTIVFGTGEGSATVRSILAVEKVRTDEKILYTVFYADPERQEYRFSFYYEPADGGVMRWRNQRSIVWTRHGAQVWMGVSGADLGMLVASLAWTAHRQGYR